MPANLETSAVDTELEKVSFHSNSKEIPGLISFRMDWLDLHAFQGTLKSLLQHHSSKASILRCSAFFTVQLSHEVKLALESITTNKASGGDGIPVEVFQVVKEDAVKVLHSICQQIWKPQQWPQDWKRSVFIPIPKKGNTKECSNYRKLHSSHTLVR